VDELLRGDGDARSRVREVHPEVCFWGLAGGLPMNVHKKDRDGSAPQVVGIPPEVASRSFTP